VIGCKDSQPPGQSPLIQDLFAMLFRVDIAMATTEITLSEYVKKEIARVGLELDCSAFYFHKFSVTVHGFRVHRSGLLFFRWPCL
jgi:hypothetical protein